MTTREQLKRVAGIERPDVPSRITMDPAPTLPERLYAARERKGVDLYRAERDTKIRARYLGALERGDYNILPGSVYTKGFLRNYALYLGLDPDEVLGQWRRERGTGKERPAAIVVRRPIAAPRKPLTFSPSLIVVALLTIIVIVFGAYLGVQVLRFAKPPAIAVTQPAAAVIDVDDSTTTYALRGTTTAGATVSIATPGRDPYQVIAGSDGGWTADVDLRRGRNQFDVSSVDPETGKESEATIHLFITVPFLVIPSPSLTLDQPAAGASFESGSIAVSGRTTNATSVVVGAAAAGASGPPPGANGPSPASPSAPASPAAPASITVPVGGDGTFTAAAELTAGSWTITVTALGSDGKTTSLTRNVTVVPRPVTLAVTAPGGATSIRVWVDGQIDPGVGAAGKTLAKGRTITFTGKGSIEVRTTSSGSTAFTLNGTSLGVLGRPGVAETWLFAPPAAPQKTQRR